jgi:predicted CoA-substrate-specific enzyme activase
MRALGICLGATSISVVELTSDQTTNAKNKDIRIASSCVVPHEGNPREVFLQVMRRFDLKGIDHIAVTGRRFRHFVNLPTLTEPEATELAYAFVAKDKGHRAIVSAGGETFMVYLLDKGRISNVLTGNKCASGTGEFFLQQIRRMNLSLDEAVKTARKEVPHRVTGRCSVFCKSDCTHALNKGVPQGQVTAGLCEMIAKKISELLTRYKDERIMVVGGTAQNEVVIDFLKRDIAHVDIPKEAPFFEALGAALWSIDQPKVKREQTILRAAQSSFTFHKPLKDFTKKVSFKPQKRSKAKTGDRCILGLDVGSTTTKAVIMRVSDDAMLASIYLRTNGNPVQASRNCYRELNRQLRAKVRIIGLGVTGSGRQIAGLHALTPGVINEIIAHATAAVHFDPLVDTIFEIGGQDAKYTYITAGVASDYAMNEACSAGTGSFLEEAAKESLGIDYKAIGALALKGTHPPNFSDQCAAFISSDIKTAFQEGIRKEDIVAGLVYSICLNYSNRVKGKRPVGRKVFMQGGVCYNKAVPIAMAALTGKEIIVPPEPGLMGAFGVALEIKKRLGLGLLREQSFDLKELAQREVTYGKSFTCAGGKEGCDRKCDVMTIGIKGKTYPFGGACNKYYNLLSDVSYDAEKLNLVRLRQHMLFVKYARYVPKRTHTKTVGINRSFLTNSFYPLYYNFFARLGHKVILPDKVQEEGMDRRGAAFCYPAEIAHGLYADLVKKRPDYIFLPLVTEIPVKSDSPYTKTCVFVQGEHAYLRTAFKNVRSHILSPVINLSGGLTGARSAFVDLGIQMGHSRKKSEDAFDFARDAQSAYYREAAEIGQKALLDIRDFAIVLFGRPYNAFAEETNMGIPHKFASRGLTIIPVDFLPYDAEAGEPTMFWGMGQLNLRAAKLVEKHPNLYGAFITNFSCGPDSFIISYFRDIMGQKPSLTLELDSHTADAGLNTRIEAFIDIIKGYRELMQKHKIIKTTTSFRPAQIMMQNGKAMVLSSQGERYSLTHPKVTLLIPSMGRFGTEAFASIFRSIGVNCKPLGIPDADILQRGREHTSCKECLPMLLTTGALLRYIATDQKSDEMLVYFMPTAQGPCRFGQYHVYLKKLVERLQLPNVAIMALTSDDGYAGLGTKFALRGWKAVVIADVIADVYSSILALARDRELALLVFNREWETIKRALESHSDPDAQLRRSAKALSRIPLTMPLSKAKKISLIGEIYVRRDELSRQDIVERLADKGYVVKVAPIGEFIYYVNYNLRNKLPKPARHGLKKHLILHAQLAYQLAYERRVKKIFASTGLYEFEMIDIAKTIDHGKHLINPVFTGEALITTGLALRDILHTSCGIISIGPFACMPSRVAEAVLSEEMTLDGKIRASGEKHLKDKFRDLTVLPFLAIETDGGPFPQLIEAKLETFCLQADRVHRHMFKR